MENIDYAAYLFHQGTNYESYRLLGAHDDGDAYTFRVWAPNAEQIWLTGDFNEWRRHEYPLERVTAGGIWQLSLSRMMFEKDGRYKYCVKGKNGEHLKADPYAFYSETLKNTASRLHRIDGFEWKDGEWLQKRRAAAESAKPLSRPVNIYELHLGSWKTADGLTTAEGENYLNYRVIADELAPYLNEMGYTHVELLPVMEHPFDGSWGYQITQYYAPTSRYGEPEDFAYFVDRLHREGIGVILDWVPAHFPKDEQGLYEFDGQPLYEYQGVDRMEHKGWGTRFFDVGRNEVQSFLISNALYWAEIYHVDGLRCDAAAAMLYLDFDRDPGEWVPNIYGDNRNLEAIAFLGKLNGVMKGSHPDVLMIAEESTSLDTVTKPVSEGGLGFDLKWNMGWANDMFDYIRTDPMWRGQEHSKLTFSFMYAFSQKYILPVSHDEVCHGKKSLLDKMFGVYEDKFASMRAFLCYMIAHPGKKLLFMGSEFGQFREWDFANQLEWFLIQYPSHAALKAFTASLNHFYLKTPQLWEDDFSWNGFKWIQPDDGAHSTVVFRRISESGRELVAAVNFSGLSYDEYEINGLEDGRYTVAFSSETSERKWYACKNGAMRIRLPRLSALFMLSSAKAKINK